MEKNFWLAQNLSKMQQNLAYPWLQYKTKVEELIESDGRYTIRNIARDVAILLSRMHFILKPYFESTYIVDLLGSWWSMFVLFFGCHNSTVSVTAWCEELYQRRRQLSNPRSPCLLGCLDLVVLLCRQLSSAALIFWHGTHVGFYVSCYIYRGGLLSVITMICSNIFHCQC